MRGVGWGVDGKKVKGGGGGDVGPLDRDLIVRLGEGLWGDGEGGSWGGEREKGKEEERDESRPCGL